MNKVFIILILLLSVTANAQWTKAFHLLEIPKDSCLALPEHVGLYNIQYSDDIYLYISNGDSYQLSPDGEVYGKRRINWYTTEHYPIDPRFTILQIKNGPTEFIAKLDSDGDIDKSVHISVEQLSQNEDLIGALSQDTFYCLDTNLNILSEEVFGVYGLMRKHSIIFNSGSIIANEIGGFTFALDVFKVTETQEPCYLYPVIIKTDSTCQIQELKTFDPVKVQRTFTHRDVRIFPNPSSDVFQVSGDFELIRVYDATGRFIKEYKGRRIDLCQYPDGMYFMRVGESTFKVIKQ